MVCSHERDSRLHIRCRLKILTWQKLTAALPNAPQKFLLVKYGITPART